MKQSNAAAVVLVVVVLLLLSTPLLYVASVGPALVLANKGVIQSDENSIAAKFYSPLSFAHAQCEPARQGLDWYISLWDSPVPAPTGPVQYYTPSPPPQIAPASES